MEQLRAFWQRSRGNKIALIAGGLIGFVILCCVIIAILPSPQRPPTAAAPTAQQPAAQAATEVTRPTEAPQPTDVPKPTDTPAPTNTPEPTAAPAPTATPTEVPTPTPPPAPIVLKGHGKKVTDRFTPPFPINRVVFEHKGSRNFIVKSYTADGKEDYLVNAIGPYRGQRPLITDQEVFFEINADGDWTAVIEPLGQNDDYAGGLDGAGDVVSDLFQPASEGPAPFTFSHDGERNFIVQLHCAGGDDYVANEIGTTQGEVIVRMRKGPCIWEVQADGKWSVKPK